MQRRLGKPDEAFEDAGQAGDSAESLLIRAQVRYLGGRMEEAHALASRAAAADPKNASAKYWRGTCAALSGKPGAAEDLKAACESGAFGGEPLHRLARLSLDRKDWAGAVAWAAQALSRTQTLTEDERIVLFGEPRTLPVSGALSRFRRDTHYTAARANFNKEDFPGCEEQCTRAIELDATHGEAYYLRGFARFKQKRYPEAVEGFSEALQVNSADVDALLGRGTARTYKGDFLKAIDDYSAVLRINPRSAEAFAGRGAAREAKGETAEAQRDYEEALKVAPPGWPHEPEIRKKLRKPE
jgi:tetratricopeptide (TPR) repeat protein